MHRKTQNRLRWSYPLVVLGATLNARAEESQIVPIPPSNRLVVETRTHVPYASPKVMTVSQPMASGWGDAMVDRYEDLPVKRLPRRHQDKYTNTGYPPARKKRFCYGQCVPGWFRYIRGEGPAIWVRVDN